MNTIGFNRTKTTTSAASRSKPTKTKDNTHLSMVLFQQSMLSNFWNECGKQADRSEFQVHYRGITLKLAKDDMSFSLIIPTAFYNFPQTVNPSAVSWEGSDASKRADEALEASQKKITELFAAMPILSALKGLEGYEVIESDVGTIHRHPGDFSFSATDYDINPENPGVVFRKRVANDFIQNDSVMYFGDRKSVV